jgi:hypothetical protein
MAEYVYAEEQTVASGQNVLLQDSIPCNKGYVVHRNGSGILTLRGIVNNPCARFARYFVEFNGNIAIPEGGTPGEISVALSIDGEALQTSKARVTPTVAEAFFNVTSVAYITVPAGCCVTIAVENTSGVPITVANANLVVNRTA